jgi:tRNA pseudouridine(38-40) synthase
LATATGAAYSARRIEQALKSVLGRPVTLHGAGRTDAGVHAAAQVAHFEVSGSIPAERGRNSQRSPT